MISQVSRQKLPMNAVATTLASSNPLALEPLANGFRLGPSVVDTRVWIPQVERFSLVYGPVAVRTVC